MRESGEKVQKPRELKASPVKLLIDSKFVQTETSICSKQGKITKKKKKNKIGRY